MVWSLLAFSLCNTRGNPGVYSGFFKGGRGGSHRVKQRVLTRLSCRPLRHVLPNACDIKRGLQRGSSRPPQDPSLPSYTSGSLRSSLCLALCAEKIILDVNVKDTMDTVDDVKQGWSTIFSEVFLGVLTRLLT